MLFLETVSEELTCDARKIPFGLVFPVRMGGDSQVFLGAPELVGCKLQV
ncbi:MAG: hypothetical protein KKE17_00655 [Proteobacteria bacterium]|nr:hypothetical protein [Pseudomonadota bacterium]MBU1708491.1 hypothetical protein [Pseudomonadota bacterium]